jgi:hypothetical protein
VFKSGLAAPLVCNRSGCASSSCPRKRASSTNCATGRTLRRSAGASIVRRSTKRAKFRRSTDAARPARKKGRAGTMTHDYERHGATTLFAAMNVLDGTVIGRNMQRHREFIRFVNVIEQQFPWEIRSTPSSTTTPPISILTSANGSNVIRDRRSISHRHRLPGSTRSRASSRPSQKRSLKRGLFLSVADLQQQSQPFTWTADPDKIIAAVRRGRQMLDSTHSPVTPEPIADS